MAPQAKTASEIIRSIVEGFTRPISGQMDSFGEHLGDKSENTIAFLSEMVAFPMKGVMLLTTWVPETSEKITKAAAGFTPA